jgi:hypothetical protein
MREFFEIVTSKAILWSQKGWGGYIKPIASKKNIEIVNPASTLDGARRDMAPLISFLEANGIKYVLKTRPSWYDYYQENLKPADMHTLHGFCLLVSSAIKPGANSCIHC